MMIEKELINFFIFNCKVIVMSFIYFLQFRLLKEYIDTIGNNI